MKVSADKCLALIIDDQERLLPVIHDHDSLLKNTCTLLQGLLLLDVPFLITQQYTKGLGMTDAAILKAAQTTEYLEKRTFSCWGCESIQEQIIGYNRPQILLAGIESHICVQQTALDLLAHGYEVMLITDCISSRKQTDREIALLRLQAEGAMVTTTESLLFELMETSLHPNFKEISRLIK